MQLPTVVREACRVLRKLFLPLALRSGELHEARAPLLLLLIPLDDPDARRYRHETGAR